MTVQETAETTKEEIEKPDPDSCNGIMEEVYDIGNKYAGGELTFEAFKILIEQSFKEYSIYYSCDVIKSIIDHIKIVEAHQQAFSKAQVELTKIREVLYNFYRKNRRRENAKSIREKTNAPSA